MLLVNMNIPLLLYESHYTSADTSVANVAAVGIVSESGWPICEERPPLDERGVGAQVARPEASLAGEGVDGAGKLGVLDLGGWGARLGLYVQREDIWRGQMDRGWRASTCVPTFASSSSTGKQPSRSDGSASAAASPRRSVRRACASAWVKIRERVRERVRVRVCWRCERWV